MPKSHNSFSTMASPSDLQYFLEIASTLNFSRAAERLGMSQPSLTQSVQRLEHALGEQVFVRHKKGVTLTLPGKQLLAHTRSLLQTWDEVKSKSSASTREIRGSFTIGCHPSVAIYALVPFLPKIQEYKDLEIHLVHDLSRKITERIVSSEIDIGIVVNPVRHPDLLIQKLYDDEVAFWRSALSSIPQSPSILIFDPNLIQSQALIKKAAKAGISYTRTLQSSNLEVVTSLTAAGCGIGILPTRVAQSSAKKLVRIPGSPIFKDEVCLITRIENKKVASIQFICGAIKNSAT